MINEKEVTEYLNNIIKSIHLKNLQKSELVICSGFNFDLDSTLNIEKLFSLPSKEISIFFNIDFKRNLYNEIIAKGNRNSIFWCYLEEFLLFNNVDLLKSFFEIHFVINPIYKNLLPFSLEIYQDNISDENLEEDINTEYLDVVLLNSEILEKIENTIGQIYLSKSRYYFVPIERFPNKLGKISYSSSKEPETTNYLKFTITEDEGSWIELIETVNNLNKDIGIKISISSEILKAEYEKHIQHLKIFYSNTILITSEDFEEAKNKFPIIEKILKNTWNLSEFKSFKVYRGVRSEQNITIEEENQKNVISDILTQVKNAQEGNSYRDIFVTAPTGSGKSLMFQIPAIALHEQNLLTVVISPLIALMNDQIQSLRDRNLEIAATLNSSICINEKNEIIEKTQTGEISILYLSPESLLSRSDITMLIGTRKIGLLVVDEAHIVTTWGKAFRPDYWYLGNYIQKLRRTQQFPIATFTATAIYKGPEDMFSETRDSLGMRDPITYFGYVPRENIGVSFEYNSKPGNAKTSEYNEIKYSVLANRLEEILSEKKKVLVYFPFVSLINEFLIYLSTHETTISDKNVTYYHGAVEKSEKDINYKKFKNGKSQIMLATKAFGMGVDIPDIDVIYHFAPTGNVCDYIQEIGRCARSRNINGLAKFDYLPKDFNFVNRLHGISSIKKIQLLKVMQKIYKIGQNESFKRNLLISSENFQMIFEDDNKNSDKNKENIDSKVKTALLIIEKDMILKLGYSPIVARPRALFTHGIFRLKKESYLENVKKIFTNKIDIDQDYMKINLKLFWEEECPNLSFPKFKYEFYQDQTKFGLEEQDSLIPVYIIETKLNTNNNKLITAEKLFFSIIDFCNEYYQSGKYFKESNLFDFISLKFRITDNYFTSLIGDTIITFLRTWNKTIDLNMGRFLTFREDLGYRIIGSGYADIKDFYKSLNLDFEKRTSIELFIDQSKNKKYISRFFSIIGLLDVAQVISFTVSGGENPEIFIRVNSYYHLRNLAYSYDNYNNIILENVRTRHENSVRFLDYIFREIEEDTEKFWKLIQDYFLGKLPEEIIQNEMKQNAI